MPNPLVTKIQDELRSLDHTVTSTMEKAAAEERDLTDGETELLTSAQERIAVLSPQLKLITEADQSRHSALEMALTAGAGSSNTITHDRPVDNRQEFRSLGDQFVASDVFSEYRGGGRSAPVSIEQPETRSVLTTTSTPIGADIMPQPGQYNIGVPGAEFPLLNAIRNVPVSTGTIEVVSQGSQFGAETPEKVAEGAAKPEVVIKASKKSLTLDTYAGYVQVTRQLLQDAPAVRSLIDSEMRRGLLTLREKEVTGAITAATIPTVTGGAGVPLWEVLREAIADVQGKGYRPGSLLVNPTDAAALDLDMIKAAGGWSGAPIAGLSPWGLGVVTSPSIAAGSVYVGDLNAGVSLFRRTGVEMFITDSHADTFLSNVFTILGEERYVADVVAPNALVKVAVTP